MGRRSILRSVLAFVGLLLVLQFFVGRAFSSQEIAKLARLSEPPNLFSGKAGSRNPRPLPESRLPSGHSRNLWLREGAWGNIDRFSGLDDGDSIHTYSVRQFGWPMQFLSGKISLKVPAARSTALAEILLPVRCRISQFDLNYFLFDLVVCFFIVAAVLKLVPKRRRT